MKKSLKLTETAIMLALGFILSLLTILKMPFGGSVTAFSMLPIIIIAYRHKTPWGLLAGFAASILQMLAGMGDLSYATSTAALIAIIFLDYIIAFTAMGLGGIFRGIIKDQGIALALGALVACIIRYICHVVSGCTAWEGVSIPSADSLTYSLLYNAAYMIPETVITVVGAYFVGKAFNLTGEQVKRVPLDNASSRNIVSMIPAAVAIVISFVLIFAMVQTDEGFDITAITSTTIFDWIPVMILIVIGVAATIIIRKTAFKEKA